MGFSFNLFFYNILAIFIGWSCVDSNPTPQIKLSSDSPLLMPHVKPECQPTEDEATMINNKMQVCMDKLGNITIPVLDENFAKMGYNDQCLIRCVFTEMKFLTDDGEAIEEELLKTLKTAPSLEKERTKITKECIKSSQEMIKEEGGAKAVPCKYAAMLAVCLMKGDEKACKVETK